MDQDLTQWKDLQRKREELEVSGSLTPELSGGKHSRPHPFRYVGPDPEGAPPRGQVREKGAEGRR
jgi:hypothetical protein